MKLSYIYIVNFTHFHILYLPLPCLSFSLSYWIFLANPLKFMSHARVCVWGGGLCEVCPNEFNRSYLPAYGCEATYYQNLDYLWNIPKQRDQRSATPRYTVHTLTSPSKAQEVRAAKPSTSIKVHIQKELD